MAGSGTGGVEAGFNVNGTPSKYSIDAMYTNEQNKMTIKINTAASGNPTFANFHVHPKGRDGHNGSPSTPDNNSEGNKFGDTGYADKYGYQVYVMSRFGLSMYDPKTKQTTQLRKGLDFLKPCP